MISIVFTLLMLILLQAVLGFDNLLYISLESKKAPVTDQTRVRKTGILIAIALRIILLFVLISVIDFFQEPFSLLTGKLEGIVSFAFTRPLSCERCVCRAQLSPKSRQALDGSPVDGQPG